MEALAFGGTETQVTSAGGVGFGRRPFVTLVQSVRFIFQGRIAMRLRDVLPAVTLPSI